MLRLSKLTDYGTVVLAHMAHQPTTVLTASDLAEQTHVALPTVSKLLKLFAKSELVVSYRGAHGGYKLARAPSAINALHIIDAVEGPVAMTECATPDGNCNLAPVCNVGPQWQRISTLVRETLAAVTLDELSQPPQTSTPVLKTRPHVAAQ